MASSRGAQTNPWKQRRAKLTLRTTSRGRAPRSSHCLPFRPALGPEDCRMHRWDRRREAAPSRGGGEPAWQKDRSASEKGRPHFCGSKASCPADAGRHHLHASKANTGDPVREMDGLEMRRGRQAEGGPRAPRGAAQRSSRIGAEANLRNPARAGAARRATIRRWAPLDRSWCRQRGQSGRSPASNCSK